jgi:eukaryotic-like serine/threonine-protein kinase
MTLSKGMRLADRYRLVERIGRGGMSEVWRADDELLDRPVAVKTLASGLATEAALRSSTWQEARSAARLTHPHVTQVYDYGEAHVDGSAPTPYLVMELVNGQSLAERLDRGPLPWPVAARVTAQVAAALAAAHRLGVVHRDIKPANVMLTTTGVKVLDFGIAALAGAEPELPNAWRAGTPAYAAPERLHRDNADSACDVYSLGALLHEALTGSPPIPITTWDEARAAHDRGDPPGTPHAPGLPADVAALCRQCLSHDPADRPAADEIVARLTAALGAVDEAFDSPPTASAPAAYRPTMVEPITSPAGAIGRPAGARIVGSAAVPRHAALPADALESVDPRTAPGRGPRSGLALVLASVIIAAGLALGLVGAALSLGGTVAGPGAATTTPGSPAGTTTARPRPSTAAGIVQEIDLLLTEAVGTGQLTPDAANDLREELDALRQEVSEGKPAKVRDKAEDLQQKIDDFMAEGAIAPATANQIQDLLEPLLDGRG